MSGYIGTQPVPQATQTRDVFTATSGQTSFATSGYTPNFLDVWLNGVKLVNGDDFTATNGSDVVLTSGAAAGDTVEVLSYSTYEVNAQTYTGGLTVSQSASGAGGWNEALVLKGTYPMLNLHETTTDKYSRIGNDGDGSIQFFVNGTSGTVGSNAAGIDPSGNLTLSGGVYLGGTGAANLLNDYEEGAWTPTLAASTTNPTPTYTKQQATYTKVGDIVHASVDLRWSAVTGGSGNLQISGLPFTTGAQYWGGTVFEHSGSFAYNTGFTTFGFENIQGASKLGFLLSTSSSSTIGYNITNLGTGTGYVIFSFSYKVA